MSSAHSRLASISRHLWSPATQPPKRPTNKAELSPTYFLPRAAAIEPEAEAIVHVATNGKILRRTYMEFADRARGLGYYLKNHNYKRVGILCPNTPAFLESIFGIAAAGAVQVGVNYRLKKEDVQYVFTHAEVDIIIVDREFVRLLDGFDERVPRIIDDDTDATAGKLSGDFDRIISEGLEYDRNYKMGWEGLCMEAESEDELIALAYTSGTTAKPKGVEYTHRGAYLAAMANVIESGLNCMSVLSKDRAKYLTILPLFHAAGWTFPWAVKPCTRQSIGVYGSERSQSYALVTMVFYGIAVLFTPQIYAVVDFLFQGKIDYGEMWRLLKHEGITHFNAAPTVNILLCRAPEAEKLPRQVRVTVAASPPSAKLFEDMVALNLIPVHVYGLTETYGPITKGYFLPEWLDLPPEEMYKMMARQGHGFITSKMVRVIKPKIDEVIDVEKNGLEIGEIVFTGNICCKGYYRDHSATEKLFAGGVLHSGDLAVCHPDGAIQILDRVKDIIISGGENISSVSLEGMLARHPDIIEVGVIAVPDSHFGERPKAFVTTSNPQITGEEIIKWAKHNSQISGFMVPREVEILTQLPKTSTGKVRKNILREWARNGAPK